MGSKYRVVAMAPEDLAFLKWLSRRHTEYMAQLVRNALVNEYYADLRDYERETGQRIVAGLWVTDDQEKGA